MSELGDPPESRVSAQRVVICDFRGHTPTSRWLATVYRIQHTTSKHAGIEGYENARIQDYRMQRIQDAGILYTKLFAAWWPL